MNSYSFSWDILKSFNLFSPSILTSIISIWERQTIYSFNLLQGNDYEVKVAHLSKNAKETDNPGIFMLIRKGLIVHSSSLTPSYPYISSYNIERT